jgi:AP-1 complex subunit beta-1
MIVLSEKPPITSTIQSLSPALLETLLNELSTLASVYHKPPETFLGQGRFGAEAMQKAAIEYVVYFFTGLETNFIREQKQLARENPIAAAAAAAASGENQTQNNVENLLDIDFDGAIPASLQGQATSASGLEDLVRDRTDSPAIPPGASNTMDDLMGIFGGAPNTTTTGGVNDLNGFEGLNLSGSSSQQPSQVQKKTNEDILGLF